MRNRLFVFMIDALCEFDIACMRTLPHFGELLRRGALVEEVLPVYPSFTYPCHVSIMTGCYPDRHGVPHNEMVRAGVHPVPWYTRRELVKKRFFAEYAKDAGYSTCLINWPVSAGADVDLNLPMVVPMMYRGDDPRSFYEGCATGELLERYFWKYDYLLRGLNRPVNGTLDAFANAVAPDIIRDYGQPEVMFVKMCDLDTIRHNLGVDTPLAREQLQKHDCELGVLMESIRRYGDFEHTNFVVMGDHGQTDVGRVLNFNRVLQETGLQTLNPDGSLGAWDAYCHSTGVSGWIEVRDPDDARLVERVYRVLLAAKESGRYDLEYVFTRDEAREKYRLEGPFSFVVECEPPVAFNFVPGDPLYMDTRPGDYKTALASHGGLPERDHRTTFFCAGPAVRPGAALRRACIVDEAPTMARMLGFDMPDVDGRVLTEILD